MKNDKEEEVMEIEVKIKGIDNGWLVKDSYFGEEKFFEKYVDAAAYAKRIFSRVRKEYDL